MVYPQCGGMFPTSQQKEEGSDARGANTRPYPGFLVRAKNLCADSPLLEEDWGFEAT